MRTSVEPKDWRGAVTSHPPLRPSDAPPSPEQARRERDPESWENTDRQFHFPAWHYTMRRRAEESRIRARGGDPARERWLQERDVHTQFLDAGIGCCWFAQLGDREPVCGQTEDEAIARLAEENGLEGWNFTGAR